ncbi:unnamed protein product, partial [Pylaiella littoralis]
MTVFPRSTVSDLHDGKKTSGIFPRTTLKCFADLVDENGIKPIMAKIGDAVRRKEVIEMCLDVLHDGGGATIGKRDDERHLYPEKYEE